MKIVIINASARVSGNTQILCKRCKEILEQYDTEVEIIEIGNKLIHGCTGCEYCHTQSEESLCVFNDDEVNEITKKMREADGLIIGSPVYYGGITGNLKSLLDRAYYTNPDKLNKKVVLPFVVERRNGGMDALRQIENYFALTSSYLVPSRYWNVLHGARRKEVLKDEEGVLNLDFATEVMYEILLKKLNEIEVDVEWKRTNFIR